MEERKRKKKDSLMQQCSEGNIQKNEHALVAEVRGPMSKPTLSLLIKVFKKKQAVKMEPSVWFP